MGKNKLKKQRSNLAPPPPAPPTTNPIIPLRSAAPPTTTGASKSTFTVTVSGVIDSTTPSSESGSSGIGFGSIGRGKAPSIRSVSSTHFEPSITSSPPSKSSSSPTPTTPTSALSLLRNRLTTDELTRSRIASQESLADDTATGGGGNKLRKKRKPSLSSAGVVARERERSSSGSSGDADTERERVVEVEPDIDEVSLSLVEEPTPPSPTVITPPPPQPQPHPQRRSLVNSFTLLSYFTPSFLSCQPQPQAQLSTSPQSTSSSLTISADPLKITNKEEIPPPAQGPIWDLVQLSLGVALAGVLVAGVGVSLVWEKVPCWRRGGKLLVAPEVEGKEGEE